VQLVQQVQQVRRVQQVRGLAFAAGGGFGVVSP
jgi:hypothetical protein